MKCPNCGNEFEGNFCPKCGNSINNQYPQQPPMYQNQPMPQKKKHEGLKITLIVVGSIFLFFMVVGIIASHSNSNGETAQVVNPNATETTISEIPGKEFKVGETAKYKNIELTVTKVRKTNGKDYETPKDGNEYLIVTVELKNDGSENIHYDDIDFKIKNSNGQITNHEYIAEVSKNKFGYGSLAPNGKVTGNIAFEVPKGDNGLVLQYTGSAYNDESEVDFKLS